MKALYIWDSEYPWDIRVEKTCNTLIDEGWETHLVCRNKSRRPLEEIYNKLHIHRIPFLPTIFGRLNDVFTFPIFFSPVWLWRNYQIAKNLNVDVIIARDLPMALSGIIVGKLRKIPVILDMAECYPEMIRLIWKFEPFKIQNYLVRNPTIVDFIERLVLRYIDHVFVMVEESKNRLINKKFPEVKITIVSNTPIKGNFISAKASFPGNLSDNKGKLILLYVGILDFNRGLDTVITSLKEYIEINKNVYLLIIGTGNCDDYLKGLVENLSLQEFVGFEGWIDNKLIPEYISSSDICLVPHHKCSHWDNTIPNKLFDYMASSKAVLISNVIPMQRIVNETKCGMVYTDYDTQSFVSQLDTLSDTQLRKKLGQNGLHAVEKKYNWSNDSEKMLNSLLTLTQYTEK